MDWEPITRTGPPDPERIKVDEPSGRIVLHFPLSAIPPVDWRQYAERNWAAGAASEGYPSPSVEGSFVKVLSQPDQTSFESWAANVDQSIEAANRYYEVGLERKRKQQADAEVAEGERNDLLQQARRWAETLDPAGDD
jgi:hypothetical protein